MTDKKDEGRYETRGEGAEEFVYDHLLGGPVSRVVKDADEPNTTTKSDGAVKESAPHKHTKSEA